MKGNELADRDRERFEFKYRLHYLDYLRVRNALTYTCELDTFSLDSPGGRYFVRSLYYDDECLSAYVEKITGISERAKLRIRSYWPAENQARFLSYEIKARRGGLVQKLATRVTLSEHAVFTTRPASMRRAHPVVDEFRRSVLLRGRVPLLLVDYEREAFIPRDRGDIRITFDHDIRFAQSRSIFPESALFARAHPQWIVMEVKVRKRRPRWLEVLVAEYELQSLPNSKYAIGIEHTQHSLFRV